MSSSISLAGVNCMVFQACKPHDVAYLFCSTSSKDACAFRLAGLEMPTVQYVLDEAK